MFPKVFSRAGGWLAALVLMAGLAVGGSRPAGAQAPLPAPPGWMSDSGLYFGTPQNIITPFLTNRYLWLWEYFRGGDETRFNIWGSDAQFLFNAAGNAYAAPWGFPIIVSGLPGELSDRPYGNYVLLRIDDPTVGGTGFTDTEFPGAGTPKFIFNYPTPTGQSGVVGTFTNGNGTFAPHILTGGAGAGAYNLEVDQFVSFARDLMRIEVRVRNLGGATRRVGCKMLLDPFLDTEPFVVGNRNRLMFETDFGRAVGTTIPPKNPQVPAEWDIFDTSKGILRGNGATPPDRVVFGNALAMFPQRANWIYDIDPSLPEQLSQLATAIWWDPVAVSANQTKVFVTYIGRGGAGHGMSDFYQAAGPSVTNSQGFIGAAVSDPALPLLNGDADTFDFPMNAFFQNVSNAPTPNALALLTLPEGLALADPGDTFNRDLDTPGPVQTVSDETQTQWILRATGIEAGILTVDVQFANGFGDTALARRQVNVPQGRLYRFQDQYQMLTFPFTYQGGANDPSSVFGLPDGNFIVLRYNPIINDYEAVTELEPGKGYWVRMLGLGDTQVRASSDAEPVDIELTGPFRVPLRAGWNMVGNPSPYAVTVRELQILAPPLFLPFDQAVSRGYIRPTLYQYNRLTRQYEKLSQDSIINPGRGIWIFSTAERVLIWPAPYGAGISVN